MIAPQLKLLLTTRPVYVHAGPCADALWDEVDATDPADVTCPHCLEQRKPRKLTWAQQRRGAK